MHATLIAALLLLACMPARADAPCPANPVIRGAVEYRTVESTFADFQVSESILVLGEADVDVGAWIVGTSDCHPLCASQGTSIAVCDHLPSGFHLIHVAPRTANGFVLAGFCGPIPC